MWMLSQTCPFLSRHRLAIAIAVSLLLGSILGHNELIGQAVSDLLGSFRRTSFDAADAAFQSGQYGRALRQLRPLSAEGDARAQYTLGLMYATGRGVSRDDRMAVKFLRLAADQGHIHARSQLGFMYSMGYGVPQDYAQAAWLYRLAADEGYAEAQYQLGFLYAEGDGDSPEYIRAHMWFNLAAAHFPASENRKRRSAIANREAIERKMTPDQIIEAQKLAREWMTVRGIAAPLSMVEEFPQGAEFGRTEYLSSCAPCHGPTGKGDGPAAKSLNRPPTDLTKLSEGNNGIFPTSRAYDVIDGKSVIRAHGRRDMPVWGEIYMGQLKYPGGTLSQDSSEVIVRGRILRLIEHISSLQSK